MSALKIDRRIRQLVGCHLLLAVAPVTVACVPAEVRFLPLLWALASVTVGQMMLVSFWAGMSNSSLGRRFIAIIVAVAYAAIWSTLGSFLSSSGNQSIDTALIERYLHALGALVSVNSIIVVLFAAAFLAVRRWWAELRRLPEGGDGTAKAPVQFSILNVLVITTVVAILLTLMRGARQDSGADWQTVCEATLMALAFLIDALCAVWAALGVGHIRWRVVLVVIVAVLLGLLLSITAGYSAFSWWVLSGCVLMSLLPIAIVVGSLLIVRACGYRLVPKTPMGG